jgi:hypothetical protein
MPATKFSSEEKLHAYAVLARVNHSFRNVVDNLQNLQESVAFDPAELKLFRGLTQELQAQLNHKLLSTLMQIEEKHAFEFGKMRIAMEHQLNPERPALRKRR